MSALIEIIKYIVYALISVWFEPMFWGILLLVGYQYWQMQRRQIQMFGVYSSSLRQQVGSALAYGMLGGLMGSFIATLVGLSINNLGINYIWPLAIALMIINLRFLCFAYAGGIIALANVLFGWPYISVPQVIGLVAILHIVESILIFISGRYSSMPTIIRQPNGRLVGAFSLQNFWPLPIVLMAAIGFTGEKIEGVSMPNWWPLIPLGSNPPEGQEWLYVIIPVVAALGYADIAVSSSPVQRRRLAALHLGAYSAALLAIAVLSARYSWLQFFAALAAPLGHEFLIQHDGKKEMAGEPIFIPPEHGVMILDTVYNSPAKNMGLEPGDIIVALDATWIDSPYDLAKAISDARTNFVLKIVRQGTKLAFNGTFVDENKQVGVILVPNGNEQYYVEVHTKRFGLWDWLRRKWRWGRGA